MNNLNHTHLSLHKAFQRIIHRALGDTPEETRENDAILNKEPQVWNPAFICAYRHLAEDRLRVERNSYYLNNLLQVSQGELTENDHLNILKTSPDSFANLVFSNLKDECKITMAADFERVKQCVALVQTHNTGAAVVLTPLETLTLLKGLTFTLMYHPTFFDESRRENMITLMAYQVAENILGPWPNDQDFVDKNGSNSSAIGHSIQRTQKCSWRDALAFAMGKKKPIDSWRILIDGVDCSVINHWENGRCQFLINGKVVAENNDLLAIKGATPLLSVKVVGLSGQQHGVDVFFRALLTVKIRVHVDGLPVGEDFI
jgi:hypothetical protein